MTEMKREQRKKDDDDFGHQASTSRIMCIVYMCPSKIHWSEHREAANWRTIAILFGSTPYARYVYCTR